MQDTHVNWATSDDKMMDGIMALLVVVGVGLIICTDTRMNALQLKLFSHPFQLPWTMKSQSTKVTSSDRITCM
jgi:hypothetical protein